MSGSPSASRISSGALLDRLRAGAIRTRSPGGSTLPRVHSTGSPGAGRPTGGRHRELRVVSRLRRAPPASVSPAALALQLVDTPARARPSGRPGPPRCACCRASRRRCRSGSPARRRPAARPRARPRSASALAAGNSPPSENRIGARSGRAISWAARSPRASPWSTITTAFGRSRRCGRDRRRARRRRRWRWRRRPPQGSCSSSRRSGSRAPERCLPASRALRAEHRFGLLLAPAVAAAATASGDHKYEQESPPNTPTRPRRTSSGNMRGRQLRSRPLRANTGSTAALATMRR